MRLHQRGVDLLLNIQDSLNHIERLSDTDVRNLLAETELVLRDLLDRDVPVENASDTLEAS